MFLVAVVEDTWLLPLKEEATFYNKVPLREFFARLKGGSGSLEATDIVSLLLATLGWWDEDPHVPEYINCIEDAQKKLVRATLPIDDKWLSAIATGLLLAVGSFPKQCPNWDSLPRANKTWAAWKPISACTSSRSSVINEPQESGATSSAAPHLPPQSTASPMTPQDPVPIPRPTRSHSMQRRDHPPRPPAI